MFSKKVVDSLAGSSMIRAMFEEGNRLRKEFGAENVYDFSIGNPEIEPPAPVLDSLRAHAATEEKGTHRYMPNAGLEGVRTKVADWLTGRSGVPLNAGHVVMVTGAAAGLNIVLKALLNPGEEVVVLAPYFVEYLAYIGNAEGKPVVVSLEKDTFALDVAAIEAALTPNTKAIILNSPNNPTGVVFGEADLAALSEVLERKGREYGTEIYVVSDEPYVSIVYDGVTVPNVLSLFRNAIIVNSFSKSLALPGERIGYVAASSRITDVGTLMGALVSLNRTLGFVNAPALFQRVIADNLDVTVDTGFYQARRDLLYNHLVALGFSCVKPDGAFYLFPKTPVADDKAFAKSAVKYNLLVVPGSGFGCPGHIRLSYCIDMETIRRSLPAWTRLAAEYGLAAK
jgi:aspartate aminotransferase